MRHRPLELFVDSATLLHALGAPSAWRTAGRVILRAATEGCIQLVASVEVVQECLFHRMRIVGRERAVAETRDLRILLRLHPFDEVVTGRMIDLVETTSIRGRDAVHAATAIGAGFTEIVSPDPDFVDLPGLRRLDPRELATRLTG
ncbi:type II toxin-antitoxin system VapC family toxin [Salana multivorans]